MPNSDTWPRSVTVEPLSNMDSASSYDSVVSLNSAYSEDSMEHLSAEERACLMYLEETIESLDIQEDSGFSNDEPDPAILKLKHGGSANLPASGPCSNILSVLAEGGSPAGTTHVSRKVEPKTENPTLDPHLASSSTPHTSDTEFNSLIPAATESGSGSATPVPDLSLSIDGHPPSVLTDAVLSSKASSEIDVPFILPPSDFMDEPLPPPPQTKNEKPPAKSTTCQKPTIDLEMLRRRVTEKKASVSSLVSPTPQEKLSFEVHASQASSPSSPHIGAPPVASEPKSPPVVAPKPKKLPANIILKPHKSVGGSESSTEHPISSTADRQLMDPQRVRMEALRKLGLLKSVEGDSRPTPKPSHQTRRSWAPTSAPLSSPPPKSTPPLTPNTCNVKSSPPVHIPFSPATQFFNPTPPSTLQVLSDIIPVPAAFSDPVDPSHDNVFVDVSESVVRDQGHLEPFRSPVLNKKLTSPIAGGVKSATLERSGLGLSSYMEALEHQTLGQLRNSRSRPASLGSEKDFSSAHGGVAHTGRKDPGSQKCAPTPSHSDSSQKLPRSQGISVLICHRGQSEESRRDALKKLGLLRD